MTASVGTRFIDGLLSITATDIGKKVGLNLTAELFETPLSFLLGKGLTELFGSSEQAAFDKVFQKLEQLEKELESAVGTITIAVQESELEEEHARIATYFSNLATAASGASDPSNGYQGAFDSFFSPDTVEVLDQINRDTQQIRDRLLGESAINQAYLDTVVDNLYQGNAGLTAFYSRLSGIGTLYQLDLLHAILVLTCIARQAPDALHQKKAAELITDIGTYQEEISQRLHSFLRDCQPLATEIASKQIMLRNLATNGILGRYACASYTGTRAVTTFALHPKEDGYFYLKVTGHDIGIDHYYGRDIRPHNGSDSGHPNHLWKFDPAPSDPSRYFRIVNCATGKALDHYYGKSLRSADNDEHPNHLWEVLPGKDGHSCSIVNKATGGILGYDVSHRRFSVFRGRYTVDVGAYNADFPFAHVWRQAAWSFAQDGTTEYVNFVNLVSGEAVDHYDGESFRFVGAPSGHPNHLWRFEPTEAGEGKVYYFVRNKASHQVYDHYYGKELRGANDTNAKGPNQNHAWSVEIQN